RSMSCTESKPAARGPSSSVTSASGRRSAEGLGRCRAAGSHLANMVGSAPPSRPWDGHSPEPVPMSWTSTTPMDPDRQRTPTTSPTPFERPWTPGWEPPGTEPEALIEANPQPLPQIVDNTRGVLEDKYQGLVDVEGSPTMAR